MSASFMGSDAAEERRGNAPCGPASPTIPQPFFTSGQVLSDSGVNASAAGMVRISLR